MVAADTDSFLMTPPVPQKDTLFFTVRSHIHILHATNSQHFDEEFIGTWHVRQRGSWEPVLALVKRGKVTAASFCTSRLVWQKRGCSRAEEPPTYAQPFYPARLFNNIWLQICQKWTKIWKREWTQTRLFMWKPCLAQMCRIRKPGTE